MSVLDAEPFFKTGEPALPKPKIVEALRKDVLPYISVLSATVPEAMRLLEDAGVPVNYPRGMPDVQALAKTAVTELGPQFVIIKREFLDEDDGATTLHYVLAGGGAEPAVMSTSRFENPQRVFGVSYSIPRKWPSYQPVFLLLKKKKGKLMHLPAAISAYLAKGLSVPEAVPAGFDFVGQMLKGGELFQ